MKKGIFFGLTFFILAASGSCKHASAPKEPPKEYFEKPKQDKDSTRDTTLRDV